MERSEAARWLPPVTMFHAAGAPRTLVAARTGGADADADYWEVGGSWNAEEQIA
jgi:hypothetical protein